MNITLHNPTDDQLDACFAERVAGYRRDDILRGFVAQGIDSFGKHWGCERIPAFTRSADAVLPWLEKQTHKQAVWHDSQWVVAVGYSRGGLYYDHTAQDPVFAKAAVIALLRAHGVTVTFD